MPHIDTLHAHLQSARNLPALLVASWDAFDFLRATTHAGADPGSGAYAGFMLASASATQARDAIGFAPSMPAEAAMPDNDVSRIDGVPVQPGMLAGLAGILSGRLTAAARQAGDPGDRDALARAATAAEQIRSLLGGDP